MMRKWKHFSSQNVNVTCTCISYARSETNYKSDRIFSWKPFKNIDESEKRLGLLINLHEIVFFWRLKSEIT